MTDAAGARPDSTGTASFDTTPLWQRDKQRVRHIRGILFEESGRPPKRAARPEGAKSRDNLDDAIEAVVKAEDDVSEERSLNEQKIEALDRQISEALNNIMSRSSAAMGPVEEAGGEVIVIEDDDGAEGAGGDTGEAVGTYGPYGEPFHNRYLCPLCAKFKTRNADMVRFHLYEELHYHR